MFYVSDEASLDISPWLVSFIFLKFLAQFIVKVRKGYMLPFSSQFEVKNILLLLTVNIVSNSFVMLTIGIFDTARDVAKLEFTTLLDSSRLMGLHKFSKNSLLFVHCTIKMVFGSNLPLFPTSLLF